MPAAAPGPQRPGPLRVYPSVTLAFLSVPVIAFVPISTASARFELALRAVRWFHSMTMGPLPQDVVRRVLEDHQRVPVERADLKAQLARLAPAWVELRAVLNEVNRTLEI